MKNKWYKGHFGKFWDDSYKNFNYTRQPITDEEVADWVSKGYDQVKSYTGSMYDNRNPMPEWVNNLKGLLDFKNLTFTFYKMETLEIMPEHVDHFRTYLRLNNAEYKNAVRILLMLEDWKPGHYLEIDGVGIVNWTAGDYYVWDSDVPHAASNIGVDPRYTLQITAEKIQGTDVWRKLHWFNIPKLETKRVSEVDPYMFHLSNFFNQTKDPYFFYMYNQEIKELNEITHDEETANYLNEKGLKFYLYEPLCSYQLSASPEIKYNRNFYNEFVGDEHPSTLRATELDSILQYAQRNNLTNITVHSCDYDIEKYYPYYSPRLKLVCDDIFAKTCRPINVRDKSINDNFTKKFISANWRYTPHRHIIAATVAPLSSYVSWYYKADFATIAIDIWFNFHEWKNSECTMKYFEKMIVGMQHLNRNAPINLDLAITDSVLIKHNDYSQYFPNDVFYENKKEIIDGDNNALEEFYRDIFCDIVTESRFAQPTANYSEKVYQPMWYKKPFVLAAPPYTLKYLKEQGFKTFSDFWDESYDDIEDHQERMFKIIDVIDFINSKSIDELRQIYLQMIPILEHNEKLVEETIYKGQ
jgi:hypothetical protein